MKKIVCIGSNKCFKEIQKLFGTLMSRKSSKGVLEIVLPAYSDKPEDEMSIIDYQGLIYRHFSHIDSADFIICFDFNGYIGYSTCIELGYSRAKSKYIIGLQYPADKSIECLFDNFLFSDLELNSDDRTLNNLITSEKFISKLERIIN